MKFQKEPWKVDPRDDNFTKIAFGVPTLPTFPKTLNRVRRSVKDQGNSLSCTAMGSTLASEYQENVPLSAEWTWKEVCKQLGTYVPNGADYRIALKLHCKVGALPQEKASYKLPQDNPQDVGNWALWPDFPLEVIGNYRKAAFVKIPRVGDWFDSIKAALVNGKDKYQIVMAGTRWFSEWTTTYVPTEYANFAGYHFHSFVDFNTIDGTDYLIGQNSWGENIGEKGFQYWPRETVNKELEQRGCGAFVFVDLTPEQIALAREETSYGKLQRAIISIWELICEKFGLRKAL